MGDALIIYHNPESVSLAIMMADNISFRAGEEKNGLMKCFRKCHRSFETVVRQIFDADELGDESSCSLPVHLRRVETIWQPLRNLRYGQQLRWLLREHDQQAAYQTDVHGAMLTPMDFPNYNPHQDTVGIGGQFQGQNMKYADMLDAQDLGLESTWRSSRSNSRFTDIHAPA
jgi:hypothetical protein